MFIFCQSTFQQESKSLQKEHNFIETGLLREKRELSKKVVQLHSTLESSKNSIELLKEDQVYNHYNQNVCHIHTIATYDQHIPNFGRITTI